MNILYYPEINIPRTEWAIRAFLYYDEVAAIVPYKYGTNISNYTGDTSHRWSVSF